MDLIRAPRALWLALFAVALVGAQSVGMIHRVEHGGGEAAFAALLQPHEHGEDCDHATAQVAPAGESGPEHNCAAIDALTLGDGPLLAIAAPGVDIQAAALVAVVAERLAGRVALRPFNARAPPSFS